MDEWGTGAVQQNGRPNWVPALDSANVAEAFHMFPRKNRTEGGAAADVAVQDPNAARKLTKYKRESEVDLNIVESKIVHGAAGYIVPRCSIDKAVEPALPVRGGLKSSRQQPQTRMGRRIGTDSSGGGVQRQHRLNSQ